MTAVASAAVVLAFVSSILWLQIVSAAPIVYSPTCCPIACWSVWGARESSASLFHCYIAQCLSTPRQFHIHYTRDCVHCFVVLSCLLIRHLHQNPRPSIKCFTPVQDTLLAFGQLVVSEQENVRRVQLANEYLNSSALAGADGSSMPEGAS